MDHDGQTHARRVFEYVRRKLLEANRLRSRQSFKKYHVLRAIVIRSFYQTNRREVNRT